MSPRAVGSSVIVFFVTLATASAHPSKVQPENLRIEILPGVADKLIDPALSERIPVVVFGSKAFDVHRIDPATVVLAGAAATKNDDGTLARYGDVDGDGVIDLTLSFVSSRIRLGERSARATLFARTQDGGVVAGSGALRSVDSARAERRLNARTDRDVEKLPVLPVGIDVLPFDAENRIELGNRGTVPVAVLSAAGFDATKLDPLSLSLAGSPVTRRAKGGLASIEDVNGDGLADLVVEVPKKFLRLGPDSTQAVLTGLTPGGRLIQGRDAVAIAPTATMVFDSDDSRTTAPPGVEFANSAGITINDLAPATPYPSNIAVGGLSGVISKVRVTLRGLSHTFPNDIDILLVGPTGQNIILMSDVGGNGPGVAGVNLTFDDDAALSLDTASNPATGTYRPTNSGGGDTFPGPAPAPTAAATLSAFNGTNPNGTWSLYVVDDTGGDVGTIAGGWTIDFVMATEFCGPGPITIMDNAPAVPYPYPIAVGGLPGVISKVTAKFKGLSHTYPQDIDALLVSPGGLTSMIMSDTAGIGPGIAGVDLVIDDNAALTFDPFVDAASGTYQSQDNAPGDSLPAPAPAAPYQGGLGVFNGSNPNGGWTLWLADDSASDVGNVVQFCITVTTMTPVDNSNPASITIPAGAPGVTTGPAAPYPSQIVVSGLQGTLTKATVTLNSLTHTFPQDLDILLTSPTGANVMLMSDVSGSNPGVAGATYTFDDDAASSMPVASNAASGTYKPTNDNSGGADAMPGPAPAGPYGTTLSGVAGVSPNGTWNLYVFDDAGGDVGTLSGGWTLTMTTTLGGFGGCNVTPITIPAGAPGTTSGPASSYPAGIIQVSAGGDLDEYKVTVNLVGLTHTYPRDLDVLLVGPGGQNVLLMSDASGNGPGVNGVTYTIDDDAPAGLDQLNNMPTGRYKPTDFEPGDVFPGPAPAGPYGTTLSVFKGTNPLGGWKLFINDDTGGDVGSMSSWCLNLLTSITAGGVPALRWLNKTTLTWDAGPNATSYDLYRGEAAALPALTDQTVDACFRGTTLTQQFASIAEMPALGTFEWFLVRGNNAQGEGSAGFVRIQGQELSRIVNSSGLCP